MRDEYKDWLRSAALSLLGRRPMTAQTQVSKHLQELVEWTPLSRSERRDLDRYFDEKVAYMVGRGGHLDASLAAPLKHLHKYRNEAYHQSKIRPETIRTAALILLEINCQMLLTVSPASLSTASDEDYSWLEQRFHVAPFFSDSQQRAIIDEIRSGLLPSDESVAATLADHA